MKPTWLLRLDQTLSSYSILTAILGVILLVGVLERIGLLGWALEQFGRATRWAVRSGFLAWERCLSWASWWVFLLLAAMLLITGAFATDIVPAVTLGCAALSLAMGVSACLAYMFIDVERYEVERGRKAVHDPAKGQELAPNVARYGHQVEVTLLAGAAAAVIGGFALLNQGLYETVGRGWFSVEAGSQPAFVDFLAYSLINLLSLVDVLDLADSRQLLHASFVRKGTWPSAVLLAAFRTFFTMIILQQVFASVRQGRLLSETIADFWSPHEPIHDRARNALPQFGASAIGPVLVSLREMTALTKEQRDQLPAILAAMGPSTIPTLIRHLGDSHEHIRAVSAGALGQLRARDAVATLAAMVSDASDLVRSSAVEALGAIAADGARADRSRLVRMPLHRGVRRLFGGRSAVIHDSDTTAIALAAIRRALGDELAAIRTAAATALGRAGLAATDSAELLATLLRDSDETVRCHAAEALGHVGGASELLLAALEDPAAPVRAAAARGLASLGRSTTGASSRLVELLQDSDSAVRAAAGEALTAGGSLDDDSTLKLAQGLASPDDVIRAQAAEALGTVDADADVAAPPLVEALSDGNDAVRARAVEALGKIGEEAADIAVPGLVRALRDRDSWVSALAAEALGEMGIGHGVVTGLIRALGHVNPQVRANAAASLGKLGTTADTARAALERAAADVDGGVRSQAVRSLGTLGTPVPTTVTLIRAAITDPDPVVRAAAACAVGAWEHPPSEALADLLPLLRDPNDEVKVQVCEVLSKWVGATGPVIEGLCRALTEDDSALVQASAAQALARLGPSAAEAGPALLRAARTGEAGVREQAMRALVMIQPPEAAEGFTFGLADPTVEVRLLASAGWMKGDSVPVAAGPVLVEALRDPQPQVRANAAHALARLDVPPAGAVAALRECAGDPSDAVRLNAALALRLESVGGCGDLMDHLLDDPNVSVRLVAAGAVLGANPTDTRAGAVVIAAADDPNPRVRQAVQDLLPLLSPDQRTEVGAVSLASSSRPALVR
jgi:HEAT repeat protein